MEHTISSSGQFSLVDYFGNVEFVIYIVGYEAFF